MPFVINNSIIRVYQDGIDSLISQLGKNVTLYFASTESNINDQFFDPIRLENDLKPSYKGTDVNPAPTKIENTITIKALLKWNTNPDETYGINIQKPQGFLRLKTFLTDVSNLQRCNYIIPNSDSSGIILAKYKLARQPQPIGLRDDRYAITYWEIIS